MIYITTHLTKPRRTNFQKWRSSFFPIIKWFITTVVLTVSLPGFHPAGHTVGQKSFYWLKKYLQVFIFTFITIRCVKNGGSCTFSVFVGILECLNQPQGFIYRSSYWKVVHGDLSQDALVVNDEETPNESTERLLLGSFYFLVKQRSPPSTTHLQVTPFNEKSM